MFYFITVILGLAVGSFLNVCIYRIPRDISIIKPSRSFCPNCQHKISALENIPVLSYIFLRGKCRHCKAPISPRYMVVEIITAALFIVMLLRSMTMHQEVKFIILEFITTAFFVSLLIAITFIDLEFYIIPDKIVLTGLIFGLLSAIAASVLTNSYKPIAFRILGMVTGAGIIYVIAVAGSAIFRKQAMGGGDVKLMGMVGIYTGFWPHIPLTIVIGSVFGSVIGVILISASKKKMGSRIPFGPFLALGALISLLFGNPLIKWYTGIMGI
ncbi:prepilin peptidase [Candidatus Poribacteria bacterium]|nr:prepilin peptidase [Candidatus Poribacteria bacterium]